MAVEPIVLEGAFAAILELIALDEVVQFHRATAAERARRYDAAIVSGALSEEIIADLVITLPRTQDGADGPGVRLLGHVATKEASDDVDIRDQRQVVELLDQHLPLEVSRTDRLKPSGAWSADPDRRSGVEGTPTRGT